LILILAALGLAGAARAEEPGAWADIQRDFTDPPLRCKSRPLWFWNGPLSAEKTRSILEGCRASGYGGVGVLPTPDMSPAFMSPAYLDRYKEAVDKAAELGMKCCLYDEFWFPSGSAGGELARKYPEALGKRLDMTAIDVAGPTRLTRDVPGGTFMGAVAMRPDGKDRRDLSAHVREGKVVWDVPDGSWKVMLFTCVRDGARGLVDYLDPEAVKRFVELTYQKYYDKLSDHFGTTIDSAFYDEPTFHWVQGGRAWTPAFNERFRAKYGFDPAIYYPALWFDIGPETPAARNALFGLRAELYATGFPKVLDDWCAEHKIKLTGHVDQEEIVNPVGLCGDLMKAFKHQAIPGIDQVFAYGRASKAYKVVSSAACNYDRPLVMTECYGAMDNLPVANLYREAMDQFAKGINLMVPHAVWYDPSRPAFPPELSGRNATYGPHLPEYNRYVGRLQRLLQGGRHVADIGVLYPIATLQAGYHFGVGEPYQGGVIPREADYMDIGERLALQVRRDFTFVHPEVLEEKCTVEGAEIRLDNKINRERYKVFVVPGSRTIHWSSLRKLKQFYDEGGKIIATTRLPESSAELGKDAEVRQAVLEIFGPTAREENGYPKASASSQWQAGGYEPSNAVDGDLGTRWNAADGTKGGQWLEVDFGADKTFAKTVIREAFDRATSYRVQYWDGAKWVDGVKGDRIRSQKTDTFGPVTASRVRLMIDAIASDSVSIVEFEVYDGQGRNLAAKPGGFRVHAGARGGKAYFAAQPTAAVLKAMLDDALAVCDVEFEDAPALKKGSLSYIHKEVEGRDVYFIANSSDNDLVTHVRLRGKLKPQLWDPHTGRTAPAEYSYVTPGGQDVTRIRLRLEPVRSIFVVAPRV